MSTTVQTAAAPSVKVSASDPGLTLIERLIGEPRCNGDADCRVAGVGEQACGGPESWRAWSVKVTDAQALNAALRAHSINRRRWHENSGQLSVCRLVAKPGARCERPPDLNEGRCVTIGSGPDPR